MARTWKRAERQVAKRLNGRRIPVTGIDRDGADVLTPLLAVQVKTGRRQPAFLSEWLSGICGRAQASGKVGLVVWQGSRQRLDQAVVIVRLSDFEALHGAISPRVEGGSTNAFLTKAAS